MPKKIAAIICLIFSAYATYHLVTTKSIIVDKIYLMNLDRSEDRLQHMEKEIAKIKFPVKYTRFRAIEGKHIIFTNLDTGEEFSGREVMEKKLLLKGKFKMQCSQDEEIGIGPLELNQQSYYTRFIGELGNACSQRKIWEDIVKHKYQYTLIMEDDIGFIPEFNQYFSLELHNIPKDADFLFLNASDIMSYKTFADRHLNPYWKKVRKTITSAKTYIVTFEGAKKLLEHSNKFISQFIVMDMTVSYLIEKKLIVAYVSNPQLTYDANFESVVHDSKLNANIKNGNNYEK